MDRFDVIVIGTGVAGQTVAEDCAAAGLTVAAVDRRPFGGTCLLRGCHPKKVLVGVAEVVERVRDLQGRGVTGSAVLDWPALVAFKRSFTDGSTESIEGTYADAGIIAVHGPARFTGPSSLDVDGRVLEAGAIVVATGAIPAPLGLPGEESLIDSEAFMEAPTLPPRVLFVGGGYISMEFAHLACAAGSEVTIVHRGGRLLEGFDADLAASLTERYRELGMEVLLDTPVSGISRDSGGLVLATVAGDLRCDMAVHGAGRVPALGGLGLETAGVASGPRGIEVDAHMRSVSNANVFAAGDAAAAGSPLTPVGVRQGRIVAANIIEPGSAAFDGSVTPSAVFADPPLAAVGLTEQQAKSAGLEIEVHSFDTSGWFASRRVGLTHTRTKVVVEVGTDRVLGAHVLGANAEEVIATFAVAMTAGVPASTLRRAMWPYPTSSSDIAYVV